MFIEFKMKMNRKGQTAMILLFLVALVLIGLALFSFFGFDSSFGKNSKDLSLIISEIDFAEKYVVKKAEIIGAKAIKEGRNFGEIAQSEDYNLDFTGNFFNGEHRFEQENGEYVFEMGDIWVISEKGENSIKRTFDLKIVFDSVGNVVTKDKIYK